MLISHDLKFIFIHVHRTGGTTLRNILLTQLKGKVQNRSQHGNARTADHILLEKHRDYFVFGFARNPWQRILSWYSLINRHVEGSLEDKQKAFEYFLENDLAFIPLEYSFHYNQLDYFTNANNELLTNKIYRYEDYEKEMKSLFALWDIPVADIPVINETDKKNYRDYYTEKSIALIQEKCKKDIDFFGYQF